MCNDIAESLRDRTEFSKFNAHAIANTAQILVRFGIESSQELRAKRADQRAHFIADAKKSYGFKSPKLARELFSLFPPVKKREEHYITRLHGCTPAQTLTELYR